MGGHDGIAAGLEPRPVLGLPTVTIISRCLQRLHPLCASSSPPAGRPGTHPSNLAPPPLLPVQGVKSPVGVYPSLLQVQ